MSYICKSDCWPYRGIGAIDASRWNSTKFRGVCKPMDFATLAVFKDLQSQINRLAAAKLVSSRVVVDGDIGVLTTSMAAQGAKGMSGADRLVSCDDVAAIADELAARFKARADQIGAPERVAGKKPTAPKAPAEEPGADLPPAAIPEGALASITKSPIALAAIGGLGLLLLLKRKGKPARKARKPRKARGRRKTRRAARRRTRTRRRR